MSVSSRRTYGTGSLSVHTNRAGQETYYGRFYAHGRQVKVRIGPKRQPGQKTGLTKAQAERELQKLIDRHRTDLPRAERIDLATAGDRYLIHLTEVMKRKPSTVQDYRIMLDRHLVPFFKGRSRIASTPSSSVTTWSSSSVTACQARPSPIS